MISNRTILLFLASLSAYHVFAQQQVSSIVTSNSTLPMVSYGSVKGAGMTDAMGALSSSWDSTGSNFTVNYNAVPNNITTLQQFNVVGYAQPFIKQPVNALVKIRRTSNSYVSDTRNHFNFWSEYSAIPTNNATTGTFNITGPEVVSPELAFLSNNLNSGYDNIFQNTINSLHSGNIERIDFIVPEGVKPARLYDINNAGVLVIDRGQGDPFKVAIITSVDANNDPLTYGPLISVTAANFGPNLLPNPVKYCIFVHDPNYGNASKPSTNQPQNLKGVFTSFASLGVAVNQRIYGYSLFGLDVATPNKNWNLYPNNTNSNSQLDPINVMAFFRDISAVLPVPVTFELTQLNNHPVVSLHSYNEGVNDKVIIERSINSKDFEAISNLNILQPGNYVFTDMEQLSGIIYYRFNITDPYGNKNYTAIKSISLHTSKSFQIAPNPAKDWLTIIVHSSWKGQKITASLYNAAGAEVQRKSYKADGTQVISLKQIPPGHYFMHLFNEETKQIEIIQLVISR